MQTKSAIPAILWPLSAMFLLTYSSPKYLQSKHHSQHLLAERPLLVVLYDKQIAEQENLALKQSENLDTQLA